MEKKHFILGGDLQKSLAEGYVINYKSLFIDATPLQKSTIYLLLALVSSPL